MFVNDLILDACVKTTEMFIENLFEIPLHVQSVIGVKIMRKTNFLDFFFSCEKQKSKIKWRLNICKTQQQIKYTLMEIPNVRAHKIISDDFILIFKFDKITLIYNYEIQQLFLFRF